MFTIEEEKKIIKGCLRGNALSQRQLYEYLSPKMLAICQRYLKDILAAEYILVSSFLKVFTKIAQFKSEGSLEGWVRRIVVNECLNELRKQRLLYAEVALEKHKNISTDLPQNDIAVEELLTMIQELPIGYRTIFNLYAIEGYSHREIAEMLNISEGTSKSQLSRARNLLQEKLTMSQNQPNKNSV